MPKKIGPGEDEWHGVEDPRKRKKIQDRLAQRARRQRLAKAGTCDQLIVKQKALLLTPPAEHGDPKADLYLHLPSHTLYSALFNHGIMLSIPCGSSRIGISSPPAPHIPASLRALPIQLSTVHYSFIDRFPLPKVRERMILLADEFSTEEFLAELFIGETWQIREGAASWDEEAWIPGEAFREKWGFLLES